MDRFFYDVVQKQVYAHTFLQHHYLLCCNWNHDFIITMVCRTAYSTILVFMAFDFNHSCFQHRHLKFQVPCIDSVFGVTVSSLGSNTWHIISRKVVLKCQHKTNLLRATEGAIKSATLTRYSSKGWCSGTSSLFLVQRWEERQTLVGISTAEQLQYCGLRGRPHFKVQTLLHIMRYINFWWMDVGVKRLRLIYLHDWMVM